MLIIMEKHKETAVYVPCVMNGWKVGGRGGGRGVLTNH